MNLKERAKKLKTDIPAVFLALKKKGNAGARKNMRGCHRYLCFIPH